MVQLPLQLIDTCGAFTKNFNMSEENKQEFNDSEHEIEENIDIITGERR